MTYLIDVPVDGGGRLLVQASEDTLPGDLELAALRPGEIVARAEETLESGLEKLKPALHAVMTHLGSLRPEQLMVEFGILIGAETGIVVAKGASEVHFTVRLTWQGSAPPTPEAGETDA